MKVLVVFANPRGTSSLRLGEEDRTIQECVRRSRNRDNLSLIIHHAATVDDIRRALLDNEYDIVHFSGHGTGTGLAFEDSSGKLYIPPQKALSDLLADFSPPIKCLLLNACYSVSQGQFTSLGVPYTIAMEGAIADDAAIIFVGGFYDSIGAGKDVEFSFRQGIHALQLAGHSDSAIPHLLKKGEITTAAAPSISEREQTVRPIRGDSPSLLLGLALDVSGSMERRMKTSLGREQSRLQGFTGAFEQSIARTKEFLRSTGEAGGSVQLFAYAFGMRSGDVCDLFSLIKVGESIISEEELDRLKNKYTEEVKRRYSGGSSFGGLESLARSYGFGSLVEGVKQGIRADAEAEVRNRIVAEVQHRLIERLKTIGDTTLTLNELAELWRGDSPIWNNAEHLIFGDTPMCRALEIIVNRFKAELQKREALHPTPVLLLVSDGEPSDGDPLPFAKALAGFGVTIVSCYITDQDVVGSRVLLGNADAKWPNGAKIMFQMASTIPDDSPLTRYLLRNGWLVSPGAKVFVQANHSEVLEELVGMAMSPVEAGYEILPKGR